MMMHVAVDYGAGTYPMYATGMKCGRGAARPNIIGRCLWDSDVVPRYVPYVCQLRYVNQRSG